MGAVRQRALLNRGKAKCNVKAIEGVALRVRIESSGGSKSQMEKDFQKLPTRKTAF